MKRFRNASFIAPWCLDAVGSLRISVEGGQAMFRFSRANVGRLSRHALLAKRTPLMIRYMKVPRMMDTVGRLKPRPAVIEGAAALETCSHSVGMGLVPVKPWEPLFAELVLGLHHLATRARYPMLGAGSAVGVRVMRCSSSHSHTLPAISRCP